MITITVNNSYSQVQGLTSSQFSALKKELSYSTDPQAAYFSGGYQRRRYLIDKKGNFPTGLLDRVRDLLAPHYKVQDARRRPQNKRALNIWPKGITPYSEQSKAIIKASQAGGGGVVMPTASGKSIVISALSALMACRTLVIVPTLELKHQLAATLAWLPAVRVENIDSPELEHLTDFDCLIIDECHHAAAKTYQRLNKTAWKGIYYRFFFTATYFRNDDNEQLLFEAICGRVVYELPIKTAIKQGIISKLDAFYVELPKRETDAYTWQQVYSELVVNNEYRNMVIGALLARLHDGGAHTLCLIKEIAHGDTINAMTGLPFANGKDADTRVFIKEFNTGRIKSLIGTTGILGEGVDTKPAEYVLIAGLGKAKSAFMQQVGRVLRRYPGKDSGKVIIFKDPSHKFTLRHYNAQKKILMEEYGVKPIKLELG